MMMMKVKRRISDAHPGSFPVMLMNMAPTVLLRM